MQQKNCLENFKAVNIFRVYFQVQVPAFMSSVLLQQTEFSCQKTFAVFEKMRIKLAPSESNSWIRPRCVQILETVQSRVNPRALSRLLQNNHHDTHKLPPTVLWKSALKSWLFNAKRTNENLHQMNKTHHQHKSFIFDLKLFRCDLIQKLPIQEHWQILQD